MLKSYDKNIIMHNPAFNYFAFYLYKGNFLLGSRYNKLLEFPVSKNTYIYKINGIPLFHYKYLWIDYLKKINFLKKLYASNSDLWFITNRYEFLGLLDTFAKDSRAKLFHYNSKRLFRENYVGVAETLNFRMKLMGIKNTDDFKSFQNSSDKFYFLINNEKRDKPFLDEMIELGYGDEPRLCISTANTNSLYINSFFYGLFGNNVPMSSKFFYFSLLRRCAGSVAARDGFVRFSSKFNNFNSHYLYRRNHVDFASNRYISGMASDSGFAASKLHFADHIKYNLRFNHIHNVFVVKKLYKYIRATGAERKLVNNNWKKTIKHFF